MRVGAYVSVRVGAIVSVVRLDFKIKITPAIPASPIDRACLGGMQRGNGAGLTRNVVRARKYVFPAR